MIVHTICSYTIVLVSLQNNLKDICFATNIVVITMNKVKSLTREFNNRKIPNDQNQIQLSRTSTWRGDKIINNNILHI